MKSSATPVHKIVRLHPANPPNPRSWHRHPRLP
jgi:hypothetical protein